MFEEMVEEAKSMLLGTKAHLKAAAEDDEVFKLKAQVCSKMYEALIEEGFSQEAAVEIIANQAVKGS